MSQQDPRVLGVDPTKSIDAVFVNAPLRDYAVRPRVNDFTLPVLGMGYIATFAASRGFNVGVLDAEAFGLGIDETARIINGLSPRWAGFNLLAPTYEMSASIIEQLDPSIRIMLGGHHAKALPTRILGDPRMMRCEALMIGEGEYRVAELLEDWQRRERLPMIMWIDPTTKTPRASHVHDGGHYLAPDIDTMPLLDRTFLAQDPYRTETGMLEANMVGARGCPYDCSFCGAAVSANPDVTIRTRKPEGIIGEMEALRDTGVTDFRFVDDLFLGARRVILPMMSAFAEAGIGQWAKWDATGRINVLNRESDETLDSLVSNGLREVALGIESGSQRMLSLIDKRITTDMTRSVVRRLCERGINVKGYFILGFPTETAEEMQETLALIRSLWIETEGLPGRFRSSVFEYRPYPGTPDWHRLMTTGRFTEDQLLNYSAVDLTSGGIDQALFERDEFNFSIGVQLSDAPLEVVRKNLVEITHEQFDRKKRR